jgi:endonuclease III
MRLLTPPEIDLFFARLAEANPEPKTELVSVNDYTLLVAVILSAQMTDKGVNRATGPLFEVADTPEKMLALGEESLRLYVKSVNLYPTKARHIIGMSRVLVERFSGKVPGTREELESLPGVGRKTANVVLNVVFGQATMPVDTHLLRVAPRTGLSAGTTPRLVEEDLMAKIPARYLGEAHHWLLLHGRYVCTARNPLCGECRVADICPKNGVEKKC